MKALKLLIIVVLCALRISLLHAQRECYHYKKKNALEEKNALENYPNGSIIEFRNDTVFIMDFPDFLLMEYSIGKYKVNSDSTIIECEMYKNISFSLSIGSVSWYTKDCQNIVQLGITKEGELIKVVPDDSKFEPNQKYYKSGNLTMRYTKFDPENPPFPFDWTHQYTDHYDDPKTLQACNWLENRK